MSERLTTVEVERIGRGYQSVAARSFSIDTQCYRDPRFLGAEREQIFWSSWQYLCHAEQLRQPGSYFCADMQGRAPRLCDPCGSVQTLMERVASEHGKLHVLVNAAGIEIEKNIEHTTLEEWNRLFAVNVTGTFLTCKHALALMRAADGGSIVNFGSHDGFIADPELAAYCASKGAVHALTRAMACDHGRDNIRVNAVCPGYIDTPMLQSFFGSGGDIDSLRDEVRRVHPIGRYGTPEDVANLVNWLAGDEAGYASGQLWVLDGGLTAQVQQMRL